MLTFKQVHETSKYFCQTLAVNCFLEAVWCSLVAVFHGRYALSFLFLLSSLVLYFFPLPQLPSPSFLVEGFGRSWWEKVAG